MPSNIEYFFDVLIVVMGLYALLNLLYVRITRKPLIGLYRPKTQAYKSYLKTADSKKVLVIIIFVIIIFVIKAILDAQTVLNGSRSHGIIWFAPVSAVITLLIVHFTAPSTLGISKDNVNKK